MTAIFLFQVFVRSGGQGPGSPGWILPAELIYQGRDRWIARLDRGAGGHVRGDIVELRAPEAVALFVGETVPRMPIVVSTVLSSLARRAT